MSWTTLPGPHRQRGRSSRLALVRPFLLLATRADDGPADAEYESFLTCTGLAERELVRHRLEAEPLQSASRTGPGLWWAAPRST